MQRVAKYLYRRGNSYEFRRVIPGYARGVLGGVKTYSRSFGDVSKREAEHMAAEHRRICDSAIAAASKKPDPTAGIARIRPWRHVPDKPEIDRAVRESVLEQVQRLSTVVGDQETRRERVSALTDMAEWTRVHLREGRWSSLVPIEWAAETIIEAKGWSIPKGDALMAYLRDRLGRAQREVALRAAADLNYDDRPAPTHDMFDRAAFEQDQRTPLRASPKPVPIMEMFEGYCAEQAPVPKTVRKWRTALASLIDHLRHDDAAKVTTEDIIGWKNALLAPSADGTKQRGQATVRNGYVGAVKPVFGWAAVNKLIPSNPAAGVAVKVPKRIVNRHERGYSRAEASIVLRAAYETRCLPKRSYGAFAKRWLPWLCAYTGARIVEMAQLRGADVIKSEDGIWYIAIMPNAGSVKSGQARYVVLHQHLIEQGFLEAVAGHRGHLFFDPNRKHKGSNEHSQAPRVGQRVAEWVRQDLGLKDEELQPNHGWRHAFITIGREIGMDEDVRHAITGHSGRTEH